MAWSTPYTLPTPGVGSLRPRSGCGPPRHFTRPATFYCHPARELFSFFNDRYAATNRRNDSHPLAKTCFCGLRHRFVEKRSEFLAKTFFLVFTIDSSEIRPEFLLKTFPFRSSEMVAARWNLVRTECCLLVQKVDDPCPTQLHY